MSDPDIDRWSENWRAGAPPVGDLVKMAHRERRLLALWIAVDWIVAAGLLAFAAWLWVEDGSPVMRFAAAGIVVLTLIALVFTALNWRGSFRGERASAVDFLALAVGRSRARLRYIRFGWWILAADLVVIAGACIIEFRNDGLARLPGMIGTAALATATAALILYFWGRSERRRAARLAAMQRALRPEPEDDHE
ncbi:MAG TPA: hypothetical protein VFR77_00290 [Steroidobacteraceae bacterium]|nr:hypothetical protein [Steroidobacteraceae bacterium]